MRNQDRLLFKRNIDPINKHYFTKHAPVGWFALGMIYSLMCALHNIADYEFSLETLGFILGFLSFGLWCTYNFFIILSYKRAPDSEAYRKWVRKREEHARFPGLIRTLFSYLFFITAFIAVLIFFSSISVKNLLIIVILLLLTILAVRRC